MRDLYIVGNGGHAKDIVEIIEAIQLEEDKTDTPYDYRWRIAGYIDDDKYMTTKICSTIDMNKFSIGKKKYYVIAVNDSVTRSIINSRVDELEWTAASLIHPTALIGSKCSYENGLVMGPYSVITSRVKLGKSVHLNTSASINQNSTVGDFVTLSPGARICGDCNISDEVSMGANSVVINLKSVGYRSKIGAGAVVIDDVELEQTVVGVPARPIVRNYV